MRASGEPPKKFSADHPWSFATTLAQPRANRSGDMGTQTYRKGKRASSQSENSPSAEFIGSHFRDALASSPAALIEAVDVIHRDPELAVVLTSVVDADDVRMSEL